MYNYGRATVGSVVYLWFVVHLDLVKCSDELIINIKR